jgi:hypothetical protein
MISWISRLGAPLIAFVLTVAPSVSPVHAVEDCSQGERTTMIKHTDYCANKTRRCD